MEEHSESGLEQYENQTITDLDQEEQDPQDYHQVKPKEFF